MRLGFILFLWASTLAAQDFNPWNTQVGARGNLMGGAMGGRVPDNAMAYYNPADLAFIPQNSFSLNAALYTYGNLFMANALGQGKSISYDYAAYIPALFSTTWVGKRSGIRWNASYFNGNLTDMNLRRFEGQTGAESQVFQLRKSSREDWYTFGAALQLNEHLSVGLMPAVLSTSFDYQRLDQRQTGTNGETTIVDNISLYGFHLGVLLNAGLTLNYGDVVVGMNVKTPMATLGLFSFMDYSRYAFDGRNPSGNQQAVQTPDDAPLVLKRPWDVSLYTERRLLGYLWTLRVGYLSSVNPYALAEESIPTLYQPILGLRDVWNVALGTEVFINKSLGIVGSLRTDFNNLDEDLYNANVLVPAFSRWNLYHLTVGLVYENDRLMAEAGLRYSLAHQSGLPALAAGEPALPNPNEPYTFPSLRQEEIMEVNQNQVSLILGLIFRFGNVQSLRIKQPETK